MPKIEIDYSNTIFYKIYCIDVSINDVYIGHTTNFVQRKYSHKQGCSNTKSSNYNCKLYNVIRSNKGWDNWKMEIIAFHECDDLISAKKYEQQYFEEYNATLNSIEPLHKPKPIINRVVVKKKKQEPLYCHVCNIYLSSAKNQEIHNKTTKHIKRGLIPTNKSPTISYKFICESCNYKCNKQSEINKHYSTRKHKNLQNPTLDTTSKSYTCKCGKIYKHSSTMYAHKKKCSFIPIIDEPSPTEKHTTPSTNEIDHASLTEKMIELVMSKNQEFMNVFMDKIVHLLPSVTNTNCHNTNNQFNIQMFLNDHCKNAMNISDFIKSLPITAQHYENTKDKGLADTLTNIMVDGLNNLDIVERPIHCTDKKRKVMYVKDDDKWAKDDNNNLIIKNLKHLSFLHGQNLELWQEKNPDYETVEKLQIEFTNIIGELYTNIFEERKHVNKIINTLTNSTYLDEDMKQQYKKHDTLLSVC